MDVRGEDVIGDCDHRLVGIGTGGGTEIDVAHETTPGAPDSGGRREARYFARARSRGGSCRCLRHSMRRSPARSGCRPPPFPAWLHATVRQRTPACQNPRHTRTCSHRPTSFSPPFPTPTQCSQITQPSCTYLATFPITNHTSTRPTNVPP